MRTPVLDFITAVLFVVFNSSQRATQKSHMPTMHKLPNTTHEILKNESDSNCRVTLDELRVNTEKSKYNMPNGAFHRTPESSIHITYRKGFKKTQKIIRLSSRIWEKGTSRGKQLPRVNTNIVSWKH